MATTEKNLSHYDKDSIPNASNMRIGIVVSEWNDTITNGLLEGAIAALKENGAKEEHIIVKHMPGSFELALGAQYLLEHLQIDGVIALGSVIQGETKHFDFVCHGVTQGIMDVTLKYNKPVIFHNDCPTHVQLLFICQNRVNSLYSCHFDQGTTEGGTSRETCARHVRRAISLASFNLEGYKLA